MTNATVFIFIRLSTESKRDENTHTQDRETRSGLAAGRRRGGQNTQTNKQGKRERKREAETSCCKVKEDVKLNLEVKYRELFDPQHTVL